MLFSNTDLYKGEWLDLVFKNRNHNYGAYTLRRNNSDLLQKASIGTFLGFAILGITVTVIARNKASLVIPRPNREVIINIDPDKIYQMPQKTIDKPKDLPKSSPPKDIKVATPTAMQQFTDMKVVRDNDVVEDPKPLVADIPVGPVDVKGPSDGQLNAPLSGSGNANNGTEGGNNEGTDGGGVIGAESVQVMPEPVGGMEAWNKFLQKTLRYPAVAQENGLSGKTFMSFIIEKDGTITDIQVLRKGGNGFDEESTRVLKLAKPWKPGMQNGKAVRVRYILPINFQLESN